jgi:tRNA pseudouridine38-40 synthase
MAGRNIRCTLSYDGTDFNGFQIQDNGRTVQGDVEAGLERMHGHRVRINVAGRTDTGVHARGQVINFFSDIDSIPGPRFRDALNSHLPRDVRVMESSVTADGFHARFDARMRVYSYQIFPGAVCPPYLARYALHVRKPLDPERLNGYASVLVGERDFSTFAGSRDVNDSKVRIVYSSAFYFRDGLVVYRIAADSFLYRMVRSIVGTIIEHHENGKSSMDFRRAIDKCSRSAAGPTAIAKGLFLDRVVYEGERNSLIPVFQTRLRNG